MSDFKPVNQPITPASADPGEEFPFLHTISVVDRVVSVDKPELVQNNIRTETVTLNLDSEWDGLSCIINIGSGETPTSLIWSGKPVIIPAELMTDIGTLNVSVVGYGDDGAVRAVTKKADAMFVVAASGYVHDDNPVPDPTTILGQLVQAADNANQAADRFNQASEDIGDISDAVIDAKGYADAAKTSETNAASSATAASQSKTNAAASASAAKVSETNAAASATAAQQAVDGFGLEVGTTTTGEPGSEASVEIQKSGTKYTANFTIPRGDVGPAGVNENVPLGTASGIVAQASDAYPALPRKVQVHGATSGVNTVEPTKLVAAGKNQWFDFLDEPFSNYGITVTSNGDGSYTINGENTRDSNVYVNQRAPTSKNLVPLSTIVTSCWDSQGKNIASDISDRLIVQATCFTGAGQTDITTGANPSGVVPQNYRSDRFQITIKAGASFDNLVIYPQVEFGDTPTSWQAAIPKIETNLPSDISLADRDTLAIDRDGTTQIVHAEGEPTVLDNVTLPALPAPTFNVYTTGGSVQSTVDVDYEQDVNLVLQALEAKIAALQVADKTN